jgi:outer membrane protein assembly factor BamB
LVRILLLLSVWSQFRGPNAQGIADGPAPTDFSRPAWRTPLPEGHSSPVLTRDRVFVSGFDGNKLATICLDRRSGRVVWRRDVERSRHGPLRKPNNQASPTPATDGSNVYVFFQDAGLISYDRDGRERWRLPLGPFQIVYGYGASPVLARGSVILPVDQDGGGSFLLAVDASSGRVRWKTPRPDAISGYSTPVLHGDALLVAESFQLAAYSVEDGRRLWSVPGLACEMKSVPSLEGGTLYINGWGFSENQPGRQIHIPEFARALADHDADGDGAISAKEMPHERLKHPAYFGTFDTDRDGRLNELEWKMARAMMASENGLLAIDLAAREVKWSYRRPVPQVPSTLLYRGVLFMVNDSGILISFDPATGAVIKQDRLKGAIDKYFASPVAAEGRVYLVSEDGTVSVVTAAGQWETVSVAALGDEVFATPAISDGQMFIRTRGALLCFRAPK